MGLKETLEELVNLPSVRPLAHIKFEYLERVTEIDKNLEIELTINCTTPQKLLFKKTYWIPAQHLTDTEASKESARLNFLREVFKTAVFGYPLLTKEEIDAQTKR